MDNDRLDFSIERVGLVLRDDSKECVRELRGAQVTQLTFPATTSQPHHRPKTLSIRSIGLPSIQIQCEHFGFLLVTVSIR